MKNSRIFITSFIAIIALFAVMFFIDKNTDAAVQASQTTITGEWTAEFDRSKPNEVHMTFHRRSDKGGFNISSDSIALKDFQGLTTEIAFSPKSNVNFSILREAGTFACEGFFNQGRGAGFWTFTPNQSFVSTMKSRGYNDLTDDDLLRATWHNLNQKVIDDLKSVGYDNLKFSELLRAASRKITPEFIREMRSAGYDKLTIEQLIRARNHNINSAYVKEVRGLGFNNVSVDILIRLKNHEITSDFVNGVKAEGFSDISPEAAIRLKNHKIDSEYIKRVKSKGLTNLTVENLIRIRNQDIVK